MTELPAALLDRFRTLSRERVDRIEAAWAALTSRVGDEGTDSELLHDVHTLKGEARVVGFTEVALITERLEELILAVRRRGFRVNEEVDVVVTMGVQFIRMLLRRGNGGRSGIDLQGFLSHLDEVLAEWPRFSDSPTGPAARVGPADVGKLAVPARQRFGMAATDVYLEHLLAPGNARLRSAWETLSAELAQLDSVPVSSLVERHVSSGRDLALELGKEVHFDCDVGDVRVAVEVLDAMNTVLLHALRNALDHGVEPPRARLEVGKPRVAKVSVRVASSPDGVDVVIEDDGAGVDVERVRRRAVSLGLLTQAEAQASTLERVLEIIASPGFSSRDTASPISGRGIGLDAVRAAAERVLGRLRLSSEPGRGMTVRATLPSAAKVIEVHVFASTNPAISLAVPTTWRVKDAAIDAAPARNPLHDLGLPCGPESHTLSIARDLEVHALAVGGPPSRAVATRLCPTPPQCAIEVVQVDGGEVLLLRPEVFGDSPRAG